MNTIIPRLKFFFMMLILWFLLNFNLELTTLLFGITISFFVTLFAYEILHDNQGFRYKGIRLSLIFYYLFVLFVEIFKSAFIYIKNLISRDHVPMIFKLQLNDLDSVQVAIIANSITLTPGTITVDIVDKTVYVLVLAKPGTTQAELEKPIRSKFEKLLKGTGQHS